MQPVKIILAVLLMECRITITIGVGKFWSLVRFYSMPICVECKWLSKVALQFSIVRLHKFHWDRVIVAINAAHAVTEAIYMTEKELITNGDSHQGEDYEMRGGRTERVQCY
ncbi:hypothetical protein C8R44DRAFT_740461 [Mycena epipterygia]|nr:hypothetical protein C8R44DRAFT_740461 [Mycena epipterygia]